MLLLLTDILKYCSFLYLHHTLQPYVQTGMKRSDDDVDNDTSADTNDDDDVDDDYDDDDNYTSADTNDDDDDDDDEDDDDGDDDDDHDDDDDDIVPISTFAFLQLITDDCNHQAFLLTSPKYINNEILY